MIFEIETLLSTSIYINKLGIIITWYELVRKYFEDWLQY